MDNIQYQFEFESLCQISLLGELVNVPKPLSGGLLHRMYALKTAKGKYAIKLLNPQIMLRPTAMMNYINSEKIAYFASKKLPVLPAIKINGNFVQKVNSQFYLVFNWVKGKSLKQNEIDKNHCEKISEILAAIHKTDFSELGLINNPSNNFDLIEWSYYMEKGKESNAEWVDLFHKNITNLKDWNTSAIKSSELLASNMVISHRDLDSKNVLWNDYDPILIDWESAGFINPMQDLIETAIYWSENEEGEIDKDRFFSFLRGYKISSGKLQADWNTVLANGFSGKLGWLEYNLKRSLWIECTDEQEQQMGTAQVITTINDMRHYAAQIPKLLNWLNKFL